MDIELLAEGASLSLSVDQNRWTQVVLKLGSENTPLGAESIEYLAKRFISALRLDEIEQDSVAEHAAKPVWIASLAERHSVFFRSPSDFVTRILVQDKDAHWIAEFDVSADQGKDWVRQLTPFTEV